MTESRAKFRNALNMGQNNEISILSKKKKKKKKNCLKT